MHPPSTGRLAPPRSRAGDRVRSGPPLPSGTRRALAIPVRRSGRGSCAIRSRSSASMPCPSEAAICSRGGSHSPGPPSPRRPWRNRTDAEPAARSTDDPTRDTEALPTRKGRRPTRPRRPSAADSAPWHQRSESAFAGTRRITGAARAGRGPGRRAGGRQHRLVLHQPARADPGGRSPAAGPLAAGAPARRQPGAAPGLGPRPAPADQPRHLHHPAVPPGSARRRDVPPAAGRADPAGRGMEPRARPAAAAPEAGGDAVLSPSSASPKRPSARKTARSSIGGNLLARGGGSPEGVAIRGRYRTPITPLVCPSRAGGPVRRHRAQASTGRTH